MIIGLENELAIGISGSHTEATRKDLVLATLNAVKELTTAVPCQEGGISLPGFMLLNGSRIYQDVGGYIESATPEVRTPLEALIYQRANESILQMALSKVIAKRHIDPTNVNLIRSVTDYNGHYRGMHLNISARNNDAAALTEYLTPFLVTRFYAYAGGFGPAGFVMSQKNAAIKVLASKDTRENRGIIDLRNEPLACPPYRRIHITHGDACMSELSIYLSVACTSLVVKMLDDGACVGPTYSLFDPVGALTQCDGDFNWTKRLRLTSGLTASPMEIQWHYLKAAETYSQKQGATWMRKTIRRWKLALDTLQAKGPDGLFCKLDPFIKRKLYSKYLQKNGLTLDEFSIWCGPVTTAKLHIGGKLHRDIKGYLKERMPAVQFYFLEESLCRNKLEWSGLPKAISLFNKMIALDMMYHNVGNQGLYFRLRDTGILDSKLLGYKIVKNAVCHPPRGTRAFARSSAIREVANEAGTVANWTEVRNKSRRTTFLDPLLTTYVWQLLKGPELKK